MLLSGVLVHWRVRELCVAAPDVLCLPNEVLQQVSLILGEQKDLGLFDDVTQISDKVTAFFG